MRVDDCKTMGYISLTLTLQGDKNQSYFWDFVPDLNDPGLLSLGADLLQVCEGVGPLLHRGLENCT